MYSGLVEPWLGSWAELRATYARFRAGEISEEQGAEEIERRLMTRSEAGKLGGRGRKASDDDQELSLGARGGTSRDYLLAHLRRDDPDLAGRVERGELSANAAAVRKGWRKKREPDPFDELVRWWRRADEGRRSRFMDFINAQLKGEAA